MYPYGLYMDRTFLLLIPAILLSMYASFKVSSTTKKYFKVRAMKGMTGQEVARRILDYNGLSSAFFLLFCFILSFLIL